MGENQRIYPAENEQTKGKPSPPPPPPPPAGTYVVQYPKQQTHNGPSQRRRPFRPEYFSPPRRRRNHCCCCFCWIVALVLLLLLIVAIAGAVLYFLYKPQAPKYDVQGISVKRFSFSTDETLSAQFAVTVRARNPNKKIGVYYEKHNRLAVLFSGQELCSGGFPAFYQGHQNTSVFKATLTGSGVQFSQGLKSSLNSQQAKAKVPLDVVIDAPVKIKVWGWKSPKVIVDLRCRLTVDKLAANRAVKIEDKSCKVDVKLKLWKFTIP
ncbi:hypothetical protein SUGI_1108070 [Cryptomeria japonica]|uniref:NDR1/HIN1-like protein 13 n=1 Tax=Cryptomeria japonica TaxID=3369 RepID=UPI002414AE66|nr:NDR1/HIN1-like protein 13 [Cryptomeria japonica]GLJ52102.1 hypothetical protein SUGI_1108070 [Cryptomeria japonica]